MGRLLKCRRVRNTTYRDCKVLPLSPSPRLLKVLLHTCYMGAFIGSVKWSKQILEACSLVVYVRLLWYAALKSGPKDKSGIQQACSLPGAEQPAKRHPHLKGQKCPLAAGFGLDAVAAKPPKQSEVTDTTRHDTTRLRDRMRESPLFSTLTKGPLSSHKNA